MNLVTDIIDVQDPPESSKNEHTHNRTQTLSYNHVSKNYFLPGRKNTTTTILRLMTGCHYSVESSS